MGNALTFRMATSADAATIHDAVLGLSDAMDERHRVVSTPQDIARHGFGDKPAFEALIAQDGPETAGVCVFFPSFSTYRGKPGAYVLDLYVYPQWRRRGVAGGLLQRVAAITRARGGAYVRLSVDAANVSAQLFYEGLGMKHATRERILSAHDEAFAALADAGDRLASKETG